MMQNAQNKSSKRLTASGQSQQASKQANIHTHRHNEVMLVWGSLRITTIMPFNIDVSVMKSDYHQLRKGGGRAFIKELHHSHVGCSCNDCNGSTICIYHEQKFRYTFYMSCWHSHSRYGQEQVGRNSS